MFRLCLGLCKRYVCAGTIPTSIGFLTSVSYLDLGANKFMGIIIILTISKLIQFINVYYRNYPINHWIADKFNSNELCIEFIEWLVKTVNVNNILMAIVIRMRLLSIVMFMYTA